MNSREAFERNECEKYNINYDDMKKNWDWYESQFGYRYHPDSQRGKAWIAWRESWQQQQKIIDELQEKNRILQNAADIEEQLKNELQKRIDLIDDLYLGLIAECELWGFQSNQAQRARELLEQALRGGQ